MSVKIRSPEFFEIYNALAVGRENMIKHQVILPCPFCGASPKVWSGGDHLGVGTYIVCINCDIEVFDKVRADVIIKWNRRFPG